MRYAVIRASTPPGAPTATPCLTALLIIGDVPDGTTRDDVMAALEASGRAAAYTGNGKPFAGHDLRGETSLGWPSGLIIPDDVPTAAWDQLGGQAAQPVPDASTFKLSPIVSASGPPPAASRSSSPR